jgi:tetratricopeptide (TPR) repeat protein
MVDKYFDNLGDSVKKLFDGLSKHLLPLFDPPVFQRILIGYLVLLCVYILGTKLATPIFKTDTDMWYHLNGGRYFWSNGEVPHTTFFSFLEPQREWVNYFWGFQAIVYQIHDLFGYQGLVIFRSLMFSSTVVLVLIYIFSDQKSREKPALYVVLAGLFIVLLAWRTPGVRPHMFSYLFIALFLYVLEYRPKLAPWLPFAMVCWVNTHGVEWVISGLIAGSYLIEYVHSGRKEGKTWRELIDRYSLSILACAAVLAINPFGLSVLASSFSHDSDIYLFISELSEINLAVLYSFVFSFANLSITTAVTFYAGLEVVGLLLLLKTKRLRVSHAIMAAGGVFLLFKGVRFIWEWLFLSLPLIHAALRVYMDMYGLRWRLSIRRSVLVGYFAIIPFVNLAHDFGKYPHYPFHGEHLQTQMVSFLNEHHAQGNLLAGPVDSGYLQWGLYPNILIYSDMEFPPFGAMEVYTVTWSLRNAEAFRKLLGKYQLDFVVVGVDATYFKEMIVDFPQFVPVFLDDMRILYANKNTQSGLTEQYAIEKVDPYDLTGKSISDEALIEELMRLHEVNPDDRRTNLALAKTLFEQKRYPEALGYAERYSDLYPHDPNSHYWVGKILENMDRCDLAIIQYKKALEYSTGSFTATVQNHIGSCAYYQQDFETAFEWFSQSMNPYRINEDAPHMYQYAYVTAIVDDVDKAIRILDMMLLTLDPKETSLKAKAERLRKDLSSSHIKELGVVSWLKSLIQ